MWFVRAGCVRVLKAVAVSNVIFFVCFSPKEPSAVREVMAYIRLAECSD
jgi:hypothetical protein